MAEAVYDIPLDQSTFELNAPFAVKTLVFVNGSNANVNVADDTGRTFTIGAGDGGPVPVLGGRHFRLTSATAATSGSAYVIATDKRLPGAVGALTAGGVGSSVTVTNFPATQPISGTVGVNNFPATQPVSAAAGAVADLAHGQALMAGSVPVVIASNQSALPVTPGNQSLGAQGNLWNAAVVGAGGNSAAVQLANQHYAAVFGNANAATTLSLQYSADGVNFYNVAQSVLAGAGNFGFTNLIVPAGIYVRLSTSGAATITATLLGSA